MTRKQLEDLGLTKEQADSVMKINGDDIENAKGTASTEIKNLQTEVEGLKTQVGDRDKCCGRQCKCRTGTVAYAVESGYSGTKFTESGNAEHGCFCCQ